MTYLIESCRVAPPPGRVADRSLPLTFFDIVWLHFHPIRRLFFYELPCSKPYFTDTLVPKLKHSLSQTLEHYFPLAGNLLYPLDTDKKPIIRYVSGDSVPLTIFESNDDFDVLVGNQARDADVFYGYIPQPPPIITDDESSNHKLEVFAIQITFFPGRGICIGLANHHVVGDASSILGFIRAWASTCKLGGDDDDKSLPVFDRDLLKDPLGLSSIYWNGNKNIPLKLSSFPLPTKRVRATYVLDQSDIKKLKDSVIAKFPDFVHPSSFVMAAAYVWSCLVKSLMAYEEGEDKIEVDDDEMEYFLFAADGRARIDPSLPENYFGNCLFPGLVNVRHEELVGDNGFFVAAKTIGEEIRNNVNNKEKVMNGLDENTMAKLGSLAQKRMFSVSGSARVDLYGGADFGWGKASKMETLSIDGERYSMSLCKERDCEGGLEVGLSLSKVKMDAFAALFADGKKRF
ncbi:hypothetical protein CASFOL_040894 [Castilleja foliolosa]|uniref:Uncharacterized protein n=1 Tax=Castilleja foliolosa TaxID=1961234 RepID=A0ABD3BCW5_9LAMI